MLGDGSTVVRGGRLADPEAVRSSARAAAANPRVGLHGISVAALDTGDADAVLAAAELPHGKAQQTTVARLSEAGFELVQTLDPPHHTLVLPNPMTDEDWERLVSAFDPPEINPYPSRRNR